MTSHTEKSKNRELIMLGRPYMKGWLISTGIFIASSTTQLIVPLFLSELIDSLSIMEVRVDLIILIISLNVATLITGVALEYSSSYYSNRCTMDVRRTLFSHVLDIRPQSLAKESTGNLMSVIAMDVPSVSRIAAAFVPIIAGNVFSFILAVFVLSRLSPHLLLLCFLFIPFHLLSWRKEYVPMLESGREEREKTGVINERVREGIEGAMMIKLYRAKKFFLDYFDKVQGEWFGHAKRLLIHQGLLDGAVLVIDWIAPYIILGAGMFMAAKGHITIGALIAFFTAMHIFFDRLSAIFRNVSSFPQAVAAYERIDAVLKSPTETIRDGLPFPAKCDLRIEGLEFSYEPERRVLNGPTLEIRDGEKVAIVGATGSGKSTLARIIAGYYDEYEGKVLLGGRDLREYSTTELRENIAYVDGSFPLFNISIEENIALGSKFREEDLKMAMEMAGIDFESSVGEGGNLLSTGQRQRINLARALIRRPRVLILDEATSGVDSEKESKIYQRMKELGNTLIVISHRLSTVIYAERIYLIKEGRIIDSGTHEDLLKRNEYYKALMLEQLVT